MPPHLSTTDCSVLHRRLITLRVQMIFSMATATVGLLFLIASGVRIWAGPGFDGQVIGGLVFSMACLIIGQAGATQAALGITDLGGLEMLRRIFDLYHMSNTEMRMLVRRGGIETGDILRRYVRHVLAAGIFGTASLLVLIAFGLEQICTVSVPGLSGITTFVLAFAILLASGQLTMASFVAEEYRRATLDPLSLRAIFRAATDPEAVCRAIGNDFHASRMILAGTEDQSPEEPQ